MLKTTLTFILGLVIGALLQYGYLWYQVFEKLPGVWCQVYTGKMSVEMSEQCKKYENHE